MSSHCSRSRQNENIGRSRRRERRAREQRIPVGQAHRLRGSFALGRPGFLERPLVDGEATRGTGCGEDTETRDDRLRRQSEAHVGTFVHPSHVANRKHVSGVCDNLTNQTDAKPRPVVVCLADPCHARPASRGRKYENGGNGRGSRHNDYDKRLVLEPAITVTDRPRNCREMTTHRHLLPVDQEGEPPEDRGLCTTAR